MTACHRPRARSVRALLGAILGGVLILPAENSPAGAASPVSCGGAAMQGAGPQDKVVRELKELCNFSWALITTANVSRIVEGSFLLPPGAANLQVYQGAGFSSAASQPIVMCQGRKSRN